MVLRSTSRFWPIHAAGGCLLLHAAVLVLFPDYSDARSYLCIGLAVVFAIAGARHQSRGAVGAVRRAWGLWTAMLGVRLAVLVQDALLSAGYLPQQFKTIWLGGAVTALSLLAVSSTADEDAPLRIRLADALAGLMICLLVGANVLLPSIALSSRVPEFLDFVLILSGFVALVGLVAAWGAVDAGVRRFQRLAATFLVTQFAVTLLVNNVAYVLLKRQGASAFDLAADVPPLLFGALAFLQPIEDAKPLRRSRWSYVVQSAMPYVPGMAAFALGVRLVFDYPAAGSGGMTLAVVGSGLRAVLVQSRYLAQHDRIETQNAELQGLIELDALTGVGNRLSFERAMRREWAGSALSGRPFSLLIVDVDYLKAVNDTYGHTRGDQCLKAVSRVLRGASVRVVGQVSRLGGDEFALILAGCDQKTALRAAERARKEVAALAFDSGGGRRVSLSIGIATHGEQQGLYESVEEMIEATDRALYQAKERGRDSIVADAMDLMDAGA